MNITTDHTKEFVWTPSQEIVGNKLTEFMSRKITKDINTRVFRLTGKAGTGKTTILKYILADLIDQDKQTMLKDGSDDIFGSLFTSPNVCGIAFSHKAKNVLRGSIPFSKTFASFFGLKEQHNADGSVEFVEETNKHKLRNLPCDTPFMVTIHDEFSVYDQKMLDMVLKKTNRASKIIFVGDIGQLPPINSDDDYADSPIASLELNESNYHELKEIVRQTEGNPIIELANIIYKEIFGNQDIDKVIKNMLDSQFSNGQGYDFITYKNFLEAYSIDRKDSDKTKLIAYRRHRVEYMNQNIRNYVLNNPSEQYIADDLICMDDSYYHVAKAEKQKRPEWIFYNSDEYTVTNVIDDEFLDIHCHNVFVDKADHEHLTDVEAPFVRAVSEYGMPKFNAELTRRRNAALSADPMDRPKKWQFYYELFKKFGMFSYGYCFTCYKAQGSTYKNVYVDINDILTTKPINNKRKLQAIYTAVTRASHKVILLRRNSSERD